MLRGGRYAPCGNAGGLLVAVTFVKYDEHKFTPATQSKKKVIKLIVRGGRQIKRSSRVREQRMGEEKTWVFTLNGTNPFFSSDKQERKLFNSDKLKANSAYQW